jgi:uncharacterized protein involved in exopolysaccharide biosynthesis
MQPDGRMTDAEWEDEGEAISVFAIGTLLLRNRWPIAAWALAGALVALALVWTRPALYSASASFIPQGADPGRSGLASIAGQFGVSLPSGSQSLTPDFYVRLVKSRELLGRVARDTVVVPELGGRRMTVEDLLEIGPGSRQLREEAAVEELSKRISASASKTTGLVEIGVATEWASVSLGMTNTLLDGVNAFNQRTRRDQAAAERKFVEARLAVATTELRAAEDRLQQFLQGNRQVGAPDLQFTRDRLQRDVGLRQQIFTTLTQAYEDVRMREVRDTPVITIVDQPAVPAKPTPRGRGVRTLLGFMLGAVFGAILVLAKDAMEKQRSEGNEAAEEFVTALAEVKDQVRRRLRRLGGRAAS